MIKLTPKVQVPILPQKIHKYTYFQWYQYFHTSPGGRWSLKMTLPSLQNWTILQLTSGPCLWKKNPTRFEYLSFVKNYSEWCFVLLYIVLKFNLYFVRGKVNHKAINLLIIFSKFDDAVRHYHITSSISLVWTIDEYH